ncbi:MAG: TVP38/TMEM64 family protein [Acutalibacteraceae bacterium]|nr:VTT domain-containing protein [Oscillospiraceae bacterium]
MKEKTKSTLLLIAKILVAAAILTAVILNYDRLKNLDVRAIVENAPSIYAAAGIVLVIFFAKSLLFVIPASLIYISVGMAFSPLPAILISFAGISVEVMATYLLGRFLGGDAVNKLLRKSKNGRKLLEKNVQDKFGVLFLMRFSGLPIDFTSLFLGASGCNPLKYYLASISGIMPRVIVFTFLGDGIYDIVPMDLLIKIIIGIIPAVIAAFVIKHILDRKKSPAADK